MAFTDQNNRSLEIEGNVNITLIVKTRFINEVFNSAKRTKIHKRIRFLIISMRIL